MNKEPILSAKETTKNLGETNHDSLLDKSRQEIEFLLIEKTGRI
ncbi:MAG: hypothetical protein NY202_00635 [Mollicutes bacterium UO1]